MSINTHICTKERVQAIIKTNKLDVEAITTGTLKQEFFVNFEVTISTGTNEGYYVSITEGCTAYHLRTHSRSEALKILVCMLTLVPEN